MSRVASALGVAVIAIAIAATLTLTGSGGAKRHYTGLTLLGPSEVSRPGIEALSQARGDALYLARRSPHDFGTPWADRKTGRLVISTTSEAGDDIATGWISGQDHIVDEKGRAYSVPTVSITLRRVSRSYAELLELQQRAVGPGVADLPDAEAIVMTGQDPEHNRVIITIDRESHRLLEGLANRFGTEAIAIRIDTGFIRPRLL